jgi:hypothetical protein
MKYTNFREPQLEGNLRNRACATKRQHSSYITVDLYITILTKPDLGAACRIGKIGLKSVIGAASLS